MKERIRNLRLERKLSQTDLAKAVGVSRGAVNGWESGESMPNAHCIISLSKFFSVTSDYLLGLDNRLNICIDNFSEDEREILYTLAKCFHK